MAKEQKGGQVLDLHREVSIALLKSVDCYSVRTPRGQKDPGHLGWDPRTNSMETHRQNITRLERNDDNLGIHLFGSYVDIDVDTDNPQLLEALDYFLPPTPHTWGRGNRLKTHRLYHLSGLMDTDFTPSYFTFLQIAQKHDDLKLEVRGGSQRNGRYSLLPGSLHPSGDTYQWHDVSAAKSTPVTIDVHRVMDNLRYALVATVIAPYWTEGQRNDLCMAISGFMYRAATHVEDMGAEARVLFGKNEAQRLLEGIMDIAGDDEADRQMRLRTFEKTWEKGEKGEATTGAKRIAEMTGSQELVGLLYSLLADTPDLVELDRFFERYAVRNNTSNIVDLERVGSKDAAFIMTMQDFKNSNLHRTIKSGTGSRTSMTNILVSSPRAIRIDGFTFEPGGDRIIERNGYTYVNQFCGYAIEPADTVEEQEIATFLTYVHSILANNNDEHYHWIMSWLADILKHPNDKCGTALVLVGKPGSGKSALGEAVMRRIIGNDHSMQTNTLESITSNFNADSASMLFVQCDEAANTRRRVDANKMKSMITDKTRRVEPKNVNAYQIRDCARYLLTSNEVNEAVAIVDGRYDRRYSVFKVNEDYSYASREKNKTEKDAFWTAFHKWCAVDENLAKVHRYLLNYVYKREFIRAPLDTEARRNIQQHSMRGFEEWLMTLAVSEHPFDTLNKKDVDIRNSYIRVNEKLEQSLNGWPDVVSYRCLVDSYNNYRRRNGITATTSAYNEQQLRNEFQSRGLLSDNPYTGRASIESEEWIDGVPKKVIRRQRVTEMPKREDLRAYIEESVGFTIDEKDVEEIYSDDKPEEREEF